jgi:hypothetical protein
MKNKSKELDVDFIGGQDSLTKEEELAISEYIRNYKKKQANNKEQAGKRVRKKVATQF